MAGHAPHLRIQGTVRVEAETQASYPRQQVAPFAFNLANGIGIGFVSWVPLKVAKGKASQNHVALYVVAAAFLVYLLRWARSSTPSFSSRCRTWAAKPDRHSNTAVNVVAAAVPVSVRGRAASGAEISCSPAA